MNPPIKRGAAARLGLRGPKPRLVLTFPKDLAPEVVERFIAEYEAARSHPLFVNLSPTEFTRRAGIDVHRIDMEEQRPARRRWWRREAR